VGRLIVSARTTVDAVMDHNEAWFDGRLESDAYGAGGATSASWDELRAADALVLGRDTYAGLSKVWPTMSDSYGFADRINGIPKFVASRTLEPPLHWNAALIEGDVAKRVAELKQEHEGNLLSYGCGELAAYLARAGLVDEIRFWLHPVVWGEGTRAFQAGQPPVRLRLIGTTTFSTGLVVLSYQPLNDQPPQ
jgi:dihydrofolate reductase